MLSAAVLRKPAGITVGSFGGRMKSEIVPDAAYNLSMARGWESKSIEEQQAEAAEKPAAPQRMLTREQAARQREQASLSLARTRILRQLDSTPDPRYRIVLEQSLKDLETRLRHFAQII
jgi:hypothetical protein